LNVNQERPHKPKAGLNKLTNVDIRLNDRHRNKSYNESSKQDDIIFVKEKRSIIRKRKGSLVTNENISINLEELVKEQSKISSIEEVKFI